jgi:hybrid cluster-associated redox disulfide protein
MKKITEETTIAEVLRIKGEKGAEILMEAGMGCIGCPMAQMKVLKKDAEVMEFLRKKLKKCKGVK